MLLCPSECIYTYISIFVFMNTFLYVYIYLYLGKTSLHWAAKYGDTDIVKILLDHGANVTVSTKDDVYGKKDNYTYIHTYTYNSYNYLKVKILVNIELMSILRQYW